MRFFANKISCTNEKIIINKKLRSEMGEKGQKANNNPFRVNWRSRIRHRNRHQEQSDDKKCQVKGCCKRKAENAY